MGTGTLNPEDTVFVILSFEGPDRYSLAGGLGVRVSKLSESLAGLGYETHLFFVGDPELEGYSTSCGNRFLQHRWCQWISRYHPHGVYDGEEGKLNDFNASLPGRVVETVALPAVQAGKKVVFLAEEWHTAEALCRINDLLMHYGIRDKSLLLWNANNTFSFHRIDWSRLRKNAAITTVSRYMRHLMKPYGVEPLVIHNGIQSQLTEPVESSGVEGFKIGLDADFILFKMARFDPAKGWMSSIETAGRLKSLGYRVVFFLRGGIESYGQDVFEQAGCLGLRVVDLSLEGKGLDDSLREVVSARNADIVNITSFMPHDLSRVMFAASDAVLANSAHEPFGLVGLEAMASGGTAYVGSTGEDYAHHLEDAVVLETSRAEEAVASMVHLHQNKDFETSLRDRARSTARNFTWERIITNKLMPRLERLNAEQGLVFQGC